MITDFCVVFTEAVITKKKNYVKKKDYHLYFSEKKKPENLTNT